MLSRSTRSATNQDKKTQKQIYVETHDSWVNSYLNSASLSVLQLKVKMRPRPWSKRWERPKFDIRGIRFDLCVSPARMERAQKWAKPWQEFEMLREYDTSKIEEEISSEIQQEMSNLKST